MAFRYQSAYCEAENQDLSYSSMGHIGLNAHNSHHGFGNGWDSNQIGGYSGYGLANSGYGLGSAHSGYGMGHANSGYGMGQASLGYGMGHHQGHGYHNNHHSSGGLASNYSMNQESSFYSANNSYDPCKRFF